MLGNGSLKWHKITNNLIFILIYSFFVGHFYKPKYFESVGWAKSKELEEAESYIAQNNSKPSSLPALIMLVLIALTVWFIFSLR